MSKRIGCVSDESLYYLVILVSSDVKRLRDLRDHAHSHGDVNYAPEHLQAAELALEALMNPKSTH